MTKFTTLFCLLVLAGCSSSRSAERPAASSDDALTPSETQGGYEPPSQAPTDTTPVDPTPQSPTDPLQPSDIDPMGHNLDRNRDVPPPAVSPVPIRNIPTNQHNNSDSAARDRDHANAPGNAEAPDNTGVNERDRNTAAMTPMDQGSGSRDMRITKQIRESVVADGSLSFTAKNIKIITNNGRVTLRGPVSNAQERATIEVKALRIAGDGRVDNQLEVQH